jgi:hypothetical protein
MMLVTTVPSNHGLIVISLLSIVFRGLDTFMSNLMVGSRAFVLTTCHPSQLIDLSYGSIEKSDSLVGHSRQRKD